jgi:O-antigen/teichoic acid export membrane protein
MRRLIHQHTRWVVITSLPVFLVIGFFGNQFISIFGKDFHVGLPAVALLALSQFVLAVLSTAGFMLSMTGRHMLEFYTMLIALVFNVVLNFLLIPAYGITGAAMGTLIAVVVANVLRSLQVYRIHGVFPVGGEVLRVLLIGTGAFAFMVLASRAFGVEQGVAASVIMSLLFCAVYIVLVLRFGLVEEDRILLRRALGKYRLKRGGAD